LKRKINPLNFQAKVRGQSACTLDLSFMRLALRLARRGYGTTSPNPMVGAVLVKGGKIIGHGWHRRMGGPHAEIEALRDAQKNGHDPRTATLYVTLEPCCTHGRTPPCTDAIIAAGIERVVIGATDPNPKHAGKGFKILQHAGIALTRWGETLSSPNQKLKKLGVERFPPRQTIAAGCVRLNEAFNYWIVRRTPFVTVKAAMTLDGKIAAASGESKWITGEKARAHGLKLRQGSDAILVGINTILADNPSLTARSRKSEVESQNKNPRLRRIILDSMARTPPGVKVLNDEFVAQTTIVVSKRAPKGRVAALAKKVNVIIAPATNSKLKTQNSKLNLKWLLRKLSAENVTRLLVEGGGEVNASFLLGGLAQRTVFFYAPKILGGRDSRKSVAGDGVKSLHEVIQLREVEWRKLGENLMLTARID
jgi:diaminohydroxyphosphoribosylaminopyrimidine deaminase/5-amino-6-(5-phosphoribosylamino)uracil reductase